MSYQRLQTPRIYTCNIQYLLSVGKMAASDITASGLSMATGSTLIEMFDMKPNNVQTIIANGTTTAHKITFDTNISTDASQDSNFIAILGHNLKEAGAKFQLQTDDSSAFASPSGSDGDLLPLTAIVNCANQSDTDTGTNTAEALDNSETGVDVESGHGGRFSEGDFIKIDDEIMYVDSVSSDTLTVDRASTDTTAVTHNSGADIEFTGYTEPANNGWTLASFTQATDNRYIRLIIDPNGAANDTYSSDIKIGAIMIGEMADVFPTSPDMNIKKQLLYEGVSVQNSIGGQTYSNASHLMKPNWGNYNPWETKTTATLNSMTTSGRMKVDMNFSYMTDTDVFLENHYDRADLGTETNLVSNLLQRTHNSHIPFIFQFDKDTATANDSFMMCRLVKEPTFNQVANQTWNCDVSLIEEF